MKYIKFSQVFDFQKKSKIKAGDGLNDGKFPFYTSSSILKKSINTSQFDLSSLIFGTGGSASIHLCRKPFSVSTDCLVAQLKTELSDNFDIKFVYYYLSGNISILERGFKGAGLRHISKGYINDINIPDIKIEDQKHIVKILEKADTFRKKRKQAIDYLDDYLKSVFLEMFGDPVRNQKKWPVKDFEYFAKIDTNMTKDFEKFADFPHVGIDSIEKKTGKIKDCKMVSELSLKSGKYLFTAEHIIYSKIRPNLNKVALPDFNGLSSADSYPILVDKRVTSKYFFAFILRSNAFLDYAKGFSRRANIPKINKKQLLGFGCIAPNIDLQNKFESIYQEIEIIKQKMLTQSQELENQFQSLLQKAFKGEL